MTIVTCAGLFLSTAAADDRQIWECRTEQVGAKPILHLVEWGSRSYIKFAHVRFPADHQFDEEADRHGWYWINTEGYYRYAIDLQPNGTAWYHDFKDADEKGLSDPLDHFQCKLLPS